MEAHKSKGAIQSSRIRRMSSDQSQLSSKSPIDAILANGNSAPSSQVLFFFSYVFSVYPSILLLLDTMCFCQLLHCLTVCCINHSRRLVARPS